MMRFAVPAALWALAALAPAAAAPSFETQDQEMLYFWGTTFGQQLANARVTNPKDLEWIVRGLQDRAAGTSPSFGDEYPSLLNNFLVLRASDAAKAEASAASLYVDAMAREPGAARTESGLVYRELAPGHGARPTRESKVTVHYVGNLRDGTVFDSSRDRGAPLETPLSAVIPCWSEAIPMMKAGGRAKITCPPALAYGERGNARIPGGAALTFEIELVGVPKQ
jgi:FKBP-type peptidyl-prolyl cis-trans isomerase